MEKSIDDIQYEYEYYKKLYYDPCHSEERIYNSGIMEGLKMAINIIKENKHGN